MINVQKEQKDGVLQIRLSGTIEESANFEKAIGPVPTSDTHIYCKDVSRINSVGVKSWIRYFNDARSKGAKLRLFECSTAIVEQINMISNFTCGAAIESVYVPFSCPSCRSELVGLFKTADLKKLQLKLPDLKCTKCGSPARFDDILEEYFAFLDR